MQTEGIVSLEGQLNMYNRSACPGRHLTLVANSQCIACSDGCPYYISYGPEWFQASCTIDNLRNLTR